MERVLAEIIRKEVMWERVRASIAADQLIRESGCIPPDSGR